MIPSSPELVLGTAQFGMNYGVVGRGEVVPKREVRQILARAWELGIRMIDTAPGYGSIERNLASLFNDYAFKVVSKIPKLVPGMELNLAKAFIHKSIRQTQERLGDSLTTLLFHCSDDLLGKAGDVIWEAANCAIEGSNIQLGVSTYSPEELLELRYRFPIKVAQLPGNGLDQRLRAVDGLGNVEIHLRSIFLQGLLLSEPEQLTQRGLSRPLLEALQAWKHWCAQQGVSLMEGALRVVKYLPGVRYCVVGVDSLAQLEEIFENWTNTESLASYPPGFNDPMLIDPRCWFDSILEREGSL